MGYVGMCRCEGYGFQAVYSGIGYINQGPVARSLVSANRWLRGIKLYRFPWYLTLVSTNHASSNPGQSVWLNGIIFQETDQLVEDVI